MKSGKSHYKKAKYISVSTVVSSSRKEICIALLFVKQMLYGTHQVQPEGGTALHDLLQSHWQCSNNTIPSCLVESQRHFVILLR